MDMKRKVVTLLAPKDWTYVCDGSSRIEQLAEYPIKNLPARAQRAMKIMVELDSYTQEIRSSPTAFGKEKKYAIDLLEAAISVLNEDVKMQVPNGDNDENL
jgi:hypothetical protein